MGLIKEDHQWRSHKKRTRGPQRLWCVEYWMGGEWDAEYGPTEREAYEAAREKAVARMAKNRQSESAPTL